MIKPRVNIQIYFRWERVKHPTSFISFITSSLYPSTSCRWLSARWIFVLKNEIMLKKVQSVLRNSRDWWSTCVLHYNVIKQLTPGLKYRLLATLWKTCREITLPLKLLLTAACAITVLKRLLFKKLPSYSSNLNVKIYTL